MNPYALVFAVFALTWAAALGWGLAIVRFLTLPSGRERYEPVRGSIDQHGFHGE